MSLAGVASVYVVFPPQAGGRRVVVVSGPSFSVPLW